MIKNLKNRKKQGFTLVELVVVIAIIAILAAVLIPQITGYIKESRKTEVIQEAREILTAVDSVNSKKGNKDLDLTDVQGVFDDAAAANLLTVGSIDKITTATTVEQLRNLIKTDLYTFDIDDNNKLLPASIEEY